MKKSELFNEIMDEVCQVCEIRKESVIAGSKLNGVVEARILAVQYMRRYGLTADDIALIVLRMSKGDLSHYPTLKEIKTKAKNINKVFNSYSSRCLESKMFRMMSIEIRDYCKEHFKDEEDTA